MASFSISKDSGAVLDWDVDWSSWLPAGDIIAESTWSITGPGGASSLSFGAPVESGEDDTSFTNTTTRFWLQAGVTGQTYTLTNHIKTSPTGREEDRSITVSIVER